MYVSVLVMVMILAAAEVETLDCATVEVPFCEMVCAGEMVSMIDVIGATVVVL